MTKRKLYLSLPLLLILTMCFKCKPNVSLTAPSPSLACAKLGVHTYICGTDSPGNLVFDGKGAIQLSVVSSSSNGVQFSQIVTYRPNSWINPNVSLQNGTTSSGNQQILPSSSGTESKINFDVPNSDDFTISAFYSEYGISAPQYNETGNVSTCPNPPNDFEKCWRYHKMISLDAGTIPSCATNYTIIINQFNPNQLYTDCI